MVGDHSGKDGNFQFAGLVRGGRISMWSITYVKLPMWNATT